MDLAKLWLSPLTEVVDTFGNNRCCFFTPSIMQPLESFADKFTIILVWCWNSKLVCLVKVVGWVLAITFLTNMIIEVCPAI